MSLHLIAGWRRAWRLTSVQAAALLSVMSVLMVLRAELLPDGTPTDLLELVQWDKGNGAVLVVGHQPLLGQTAAHLLGLGQEACSIRKGAVWWLRRRQRLEHNQTVLMAVMCPEFL